MEETSANSPPPFLACQTNPCSVSAISESVNRLAATELSDAQCFSEINSTMLPSNEFCRLAAMELRDAHCFSEINSTMLPSNEFCTPKKRQCFFVDGSLYIPICDEALKTSRRHAI